MVELLRAQQQNEKPEVKKESKKATYGQWHIVYDEYSLCFASNLCLSFPWSPYEKNTHQN